MKPWILGARPRTLPAAIAPVLVGTTLALPNGLNINWLNALLALLVSLFLQIGVNYANDYSDGVRGTDEVRVGPMRLVASGLKSAKSVKQAAFFLFFLASISGLFLALRTSRWLILVGLIAILAAWNYTGGDKPYGYQGFGELSVFLFFGVVATAGTYFAQSQKITWQSLLISIPMGALSCTILAINNLRDLPKDALVGKHTIAVRIGDKTARWMIIVLIVTAIVAGLLAATISPWVFVTLLIVPLAIRIGVAINQGAHGAALIPLLGKAGKLQLFFALLMTFALFMARA
ncbi:MAG: 1,4-dihydroxy-2-naphthoate polyprenyltransferase [Actinomycetes bacterium]|jgi:1,4-dihydroxy-2-naphthoate polyprenyltransferase